MYHIQLGSKVVKNKDEAMALGPEWTSYVPIWFHPMHGRKVVTSKELFLTREGNHVVELSPGWAPGKFSETAKVWESGRDMGAKSLPVKSHTELLTERWVSVAEKNKAGDDDSIVRMFEQFMKMQQMAMAAQQPMAPAKEPTPALVSQPEDGEAKLNQALERSALEELATEKGVKVDGRWSNERLKKELGLNE
jgi:hypothetical protein